MKQHYVFTLFLLVLLPQALFSQAQTIIDKSSPEYWTSQPPTTNSVLPTPAQKVVSKEPAKVNGATRPTTNAAGMARLAAVTSTTFPFSGTTITIYTVPTDVYSMTIEARGAEGGPSASPIRSPGKGAVIIGTIDVTPGQQLKILVGQAGVKGNGGGGGSFVTDINNNPLVIAGGGGGGSSQGDSGQKQGQAGPIGGSVGNANGGSGGLGGISSTSTAASGGGGLLTNGADGSLSTAAGGGGKAFVNGGAGGDDGSNSALGGFGGGGAGSITFTGGGGGGYSGGGAVRNNVGGGGGSYNAGIEQTNLAGINSGNGLVILTVCPLAVSSFVTPTPNGLTVQVGGVSYERDKATDRINGYEIRQTEINQTGSFLITQSGPYEIRATGANGCQVRVRGIAP